MGTKIYTLLIFFTLICTISCNRNKQGKIIHEMTVDEIVQDKKDNGFTVLSQNEDGFYYVNSDSLLYYDIPNELDRLVFAKDSTKINVYRLVLDFSNDGEISVNRIKVFDKSWSYDLNNDLIDAVYCAAQDDVNHFFGRTGFIIETGKYLYLKESYLINLNDDGSIDALLVNGDYNFTSEINYDPLNIHVNFDFDLWEFTYDMRPEFSKEYINYAMYNRLSEHPLFYFEYSADVKSDGAIEQSDYVVFGNINPNMKKDLFKNTQRLKDYIEGYKNKILAVYEEHMEEIAVQNAKPLQYFVDATRNGNEIKRMLGNTYYMKATVNEISERDSQDGRYSIYFGDNQLNRIGGVFGYSSDERFENLHLPASLTLKVTFVDDDIMFDHYFKEIEIVR